MSAGFPAGLASGQPAEGRDFPKTLTFDEPGIDDEISLPTFIVAPRGAFPGRETALNFELDKRITPRTSVQINVGYTSLPLADTTAHGWQNVQATVKSVFLAEPLDERLASVSLTHEFGRSGAARVAEPSGSTTFAANFGQGFGRLAQAAVIKPFAVTGSFGYTLQDRADTPAGQQAVMALSLQYSLDVLAIAAPGIRVPGCLRPLIPIVEYVGTRSVDGHADMSATLAPGLIYTGAGFQLAAEALVPLSAASGRHLGGIAQLNVSLGMLGVSWLTRPFWR